MAKQGKVGTPITVAAVPPAAKAVKRSALFDARVVDAALLQAIATAAP